MPIPCETVSNLRMIRMEKGLTQQQLADEIETSKKQLGEWELGDHSPSIRAVERWAKALGYELDLHPIRE